MDFEDILLVLINKTGKNRHEVMSLIEKKQIESGGTISTKASATLVARDLSVNINEIISSQPNKIKDLLHMAPGSSNITVTAFIKRIYHFHTFLQENEERFVQNLMISDQSAMIRLTLWGSAVDLLSNLNLKKGDEIRVIKGILKNGRLGERELHLGDNSSIEKIGSQTNKNNGFIWQDVLFPGSISNEHLSLRETDIQGVVTHIHNVEQENRPSFIYIIDPESNNVENAIKVNFWRERKLEVKNLDIGHKILLEGVSIKEGYQDLLEINFNRNSNISVLSQSSEKFKILIKNSTINFSLSNYPKKILDRNLGNVKFKETFNLVARIFSIGNPVKFTKKDGTEGKVIRIGVFDNYGSKFLVLWDNRVNLVDEVSINDIICISEGYLRDNKGKYELSLSNNGTLSKPIEKINFNIPDKIPDIPIDQISDRWSTITIYGEINFINETRTFKRNDGSEGNVKSISVADSTGETRIVAWNENITQIEKLKIGEIVLIENFSIRINNYGENEGHLTNNSIIHSELDIKEIPKRMRNITYKLPVYKEIKDNPYRRIYLEDITDEYKNEISNYYGENLNYDNLNNEVEFRATIRQVFDSPLYYNACLSCSKKVEPISNEKGLCPNHNEITYMPKLLFRVLLDDGTNVFNVTMIGNIAERITGMKAHHVRKFLANNQNDDILLYNEIKDRIIGNEYFIKGKLEIRKTSDDSIDKIYWDFKINYIAKANSTLEINVLQNEISNE